MSATPPPADPRTPSPGPMSDSRPLLGARPQVSPQPSSEDVLGNKKGVSHSNRPHVSPQPSAENLLAIKKSISPPHSSEEVTFSHTNHLSFRIELLTVDSLANMVKNEQFKLLARFGGTQRLAAKLDCENTSAGLPMDFDYDNRRSEFGWNEIEKQKLPSYLSLIWDGLQDVIMLMLIAAAIVSLVLGLAFDPDKSIAWVEGAAIILVVVIVLNVQAATDYSKSATFRKQQLELEKGKKVIVVRGGRELEIHPKLLVVGDILKCKVGDILAADGVLVDGSLKMDESAMTGESKLLEKLPFAYQGEGGSDVEVETPLCSPFVLSGTSVMFGSGLVLVLAVGPNSVQGRILSIVTNTTDELPSSSSSAPEVPGLPRPDVPPASNGDIEQGLSKPSPAEMEAPTPNPSSLPVRICHAVGKGIKGFFTFNKIDSGGTLVEKLDVLAVDIGKVGIIIAVIVFVVLCVEWSIQQFDFGQPCAGVTLRANCTALAGCVWNNSTASGNSGTCVRVWSNQDIQRILQFFITAITILVVAVPEGLPLAVTLALAVAMTRLERDKNQVKIMEASETMGSATTICTDKTGTLTLNRMTVVRAFLDGTLFAPSPDVPLAQAIARNSEKDSVALFCDIIALASDSSTSAELDVATGKWEYRGNATECALVKLAHELERPVPQTRRMVAPDTPHSWWVHAFPFSSSRKRMSCVVAQPLGKFRLYTKGAPSAILASCSSVRHSNGSMVSVLSPEQRLGLQKVVGDLEAQAMRVLALAYRDFDSAMNWSEKAEGAGEASPALCETECTFVSLVGIEDPLRPAVVDAIRICHEAGVDVRMCTGDALDTAVAISIQCNILREKDLYVDDAGRKRPKKDFAMLGAEFDERIHFVDNKAPLVLRRKFDALSGDVSEAMAPPFVLDEKGNKTLNQAAFDDIWPKLRVIARCQPEDKLNLVRGLRASKVFARQDYCNELQDEHGIEIFPDYQVVAVTGDGTNDAPALRASDVGFAMGIVGTDIAQQACDIILLDDNFASIIAAIKWGRNVFDAVSKFIQFQLTVNCTAIIVASVGSFAFTLSPLGAVQMLWVNLIMDSLASLALATEPPPPELLKRPPYGKRRPMVSRVMFFNILGQAVFQLAVIFAILFDASWLPGNVAQYPPPGGVTVLNQQTGSVHWTIVFNTFVLMQLANEFNARKLQTVDRLRTHWQEWNVFTGLHLNPLFIAIIIITFGVQIIIVQLAGPVFLTQPLTWAQWGFCLGWGLASWPWQFAVNAAMIAFDAVFPPSTPERRVADVPLLPGSSDSKLSPETAQVDTVVEEVIFSQRMPVAKGVLLTREDALEEEKNIATMGHELKQHPEEDYRLPGENPRGDSKRGGSRRSLNSSR